MNLDSIPSRNRKAILVISPDDLITLEYMPQGSEILLNEQIYLLVPAAESEDSLVKKLEDFGLLETGNLLLQNPYNRSDYELLDKAASNFALAKYFHFITLCGLLGAKEVTVDKIEVKSSKGKQLFKGTLDSLYVKGGLKGESNAFEEMRNNIRIKSKFNGGSPDLVGAHEHLKAYNLLGDIAMKSLIDQRKGENPITSRELTLSLSEESRKNLKVISDLKVPTYGDLNAQLERIQTEAYEFNLTIQVEF